MHTKLLRCSWALVLPLAPLAIASVVHAAPPTDAAPVDPFPSSLEPMPTGSAPGSSTPPPLPPAPPAVSSARATPPPSALSATVAQPKKRDEVPATLFDSNMDFAIGGLGGISVMYSRVSRTDGVQVCGEGAVIIDHALTFGGGGCGFTASVDGTRYTGGASDVLRFGYGGAIIRYHFFSRHVVNLGVGTLIGAGGVVIGNQLDASGNRSNDPEKFKEKSSEAVFVFEPQIGAFVNFTRWSRAGVLAGYRFVSGVETKNMGASDLNSLTLGGAVQLGWF